MKLPILGILGLIFITLKLTGHIAWSWLWVLSPFWIPLAIAAFFFIIAGVLALFVQGDTFPNKKKRIL